MPSIAREWLESLPPGTTLAEAIDMCPRGDCLLWMAARLGLKVPDAAFAPAVLRAARIYAADVAARAGLSEETARLRALPDEASWEEIREAAQAASKAADAAAVAADAANQSVACAAASSANYARLAADCAAQAANYASDHAARSDYAARAVDYAAGAATTAGASAAREEEESADDVRAVMRETLLARTLLLDALREVDVELG